jgi:hypothetical protein
VVSGVRFVGRGNRKLQRFLWKAYAVLAAGSVATGVPAVLDGRTLGSIGALLSVTGWTILAVTFYRASRQPAEPRPGGDRNGQFH